MTSIIHQTDLAQTIDLAAGRARYDECAKKLLTYKAVIAWILKSCTKEFSQYSVKFICENCLRATSKFPAEQYIRISLTIPEHWMETNG